VVTQVFDDAFKAQYRLKSKNDVGWSNVFSPILEVPPVTRPYAAPTLTAGTPITPMTMFITWSELTTGTGGEMPIYYQISWYNSDTAQWVIMTNPSIGL